MAYILRSLAVIGVIALYSPIHGESAGEGGPAATVRNVAKAAAQIDAHGGLAGMTTSSITAAREAAQILAGLDPETRQRLLTMAATAATSRGERGAGTPAR